MPIVGNSYYNDPNIGAGFSNLAAAFAPPSASEIQVAATIQAKKAQMANEAASRAAIAEGRGTTADFLTLDPTGGAKQQITAEAFQRAKSGRGFPALDQLVFARDGDFTKTGAGNLSQSLKQGEVQNLVPSVAAMYGTPLTRYGSQEVKQDAQVVLPQQGGVISPTMKDPTVDAVMGGAGAPAGGNAPMQLPGMAGGTGIILGNPSDPARPLAPEERASFGIPLNAPAAMEKGSPKMLGSPGTNLTVNNAVNPVLKGLGEEFVKQRTEAYGAANSIPQIRTARAQLEAPGSIVSGQLADERLTLQKLGAALGVTDPTQIQNTETFRTQIKPLVLETVKGLGSGTGISNADRDFAEAAVGGKITLDAGTIKRVLDITERAAHAKVGRHNKLADQMLETQPELKQMGPMLRLEIPQGDYATPAAPTAGAPAVGAPPAGASTGPRQAPDGKFYVPDPARPGKYLEVRP
jgi:hypothetical protein